MRRKTKWRPFFSIWPRRIDGKMVFLRTAYWREDDFGAWTGFYGSSGVEYSLSPDTTQL